MQEKDVFRVDGFFFKNTKDAEQAKAEKKKVEYLEKNLDFNNSQTLLAVYTKMAEGENFKTPVGWEYMTYLRKQLIQGGIDEADIPDVKMSLQFVMPQEKKTAKKPKTDYRITGFRTAVIVSVIMVIMVIILFKITLSGENVNALNYERTITNKYASWEQELTERENAVRERENQLQDTD